MIFREALFSYCYLTPPNLRVCVFDEKIQWNASKFAIDTDNQGGKSNFWFSYYLYEIWHNIWSVLLELTFYLAHCLKLWGVISLLHILIAKHACNVSHVWVSSQSFALLDLCYICAPSPNSMSRWRHEKRVHLYNSTTACDKKRSL